MKSKLFTQFDPKDEDNKQFIADVKAACELSEGQRKAIAKALPDLVEVKTDKEKQDRIDQLEEESGATRILLAHVISIANFFLTSTQGHSKSSA